MSDTQTNGAFRPVFCHRDSCPSTLDCKFCSECGADIAAYRRSTEGAPATVPIAFGRSPDDVLTAPLAVSPSVARKRFAHSAPPARVNPREDSTVSARPSPVPSATPGDSRRSVGILAGLFGMGLALGAAAGAVLNFV